MSHSSRFSWLSASVLLALLLLAFVATIARANETSVVIAEPCGSGELLPASIICLHGTVWSVSADGTETALANVPVTASYNGEVVTGTTYAHSGNLQPTYGIDISPLDPDFLKPITLSVEINGEILERQVTVFPDFNNQTQQYDFWLHEVNDFDGRSLWGTVVEFSEHQPVEGAVVKAELANGTVFTTTTAWSPIERLPIYVFTPAQLANGQIVTLTASYNGDSDRATITVPSDPFQVNFVTGWKCDGFDPFPQVGSGHGFPQVGSGHGFPDVGCFWGYGIVDGEPIAGMSINVEVSGTLYTAPTRYYADERLPRYGIVVPEGSNVTGQPITITGIISGITKIETTIIELDANLGQRTDIGIGSTEVQNFTSNTNTITGLAWHGGHLWASTQGGLVRWNPEGNQYEKFTSEDGLPGNWIESIAVDSQNNLWIGTSEYGVARLNDVEPMNWESFRPGTDGPALNATFKMATDANGDLWFSQVDFPPSIFSNTAGVSRYTLSESEPRWIHYGEDEGLTGIMATGIVADPNGDIWVSVYYSGVYHYSASEPNPTWTKYSDELHELGLRSITAASNGDIWVGGEQGVMRYQAQSPNPTWELYDTSDGLAHNIVHSVFEASDNSLWFGTDGGLSHLTLNGHTQNWRTFTTEDGLAGREVYAIIEKPAGKLWFGALGGINSYIPQTERWQTLQTSDEIIDNVVGSIAVDSLGDIWIGAQQGVSQFRLSTSPHVWTTINMQDIIGESTIADITVDHNGDMWYATVCCGVRRYTLSSAEPIWTNFHNELASTLSVQVEVDQKGDLWVASYDGTVDRYTLSSPNPVWENMFDGFWPYSYGLQTLAVGHDGDIWVGTEYGARRYTINATYPDWETYDSSNGMVTDKVYNIDVDQEGDVWFGTPRGVSRFSERVGEPTWRSYQIADGLPSDTVVTVEVDNDGDVWFGTDNGLAFYSLSTDDPAWQTFTIDDGLAGDRISALETDRNGDLWVGTWTGLSIKPKRSIQAELAISVQDASGEIFPDEAVTYTLLIENSGGIPAEHVEVHLTLPAGAVLLGANPAPQNSSPTSWELGTIQPEGVEEIEVIIELDDQWQPGTQFSFTSDVHTSTPESFTDNNEALLEAVVQDERHADVALEIVGPPVIIGGQQAIYTIWVENKGGAAADSVVVTLAVPAEMSLHSSDPIATSGLTWQLGRLPARSQPVSIELTLNSSANVGNSELITVNGSVATASAEIVQANNNSAATVPTTLENIETLIVIASKQFNARYGATEVTQQLHTVARHPTVQGAIVDVSSVPAISAAYDAWNSAPNSIAKANAVAASIKAEIEQQIAAYPQVANIVIVGGDNVIPYYRLPDQSNVGLLERTYASFHSWLLNTSVGTALQANYMFTDDFYATQSPVKVDSPFWYSSRPLYLPDYGIGRLVENPAEIIAAIETYLTSEGGITINTATVGSDSELADDWREKQCLLLNEQNISTTTCTTNVIAYRDAIANESNDLYLSAFHADYGVMASGAATLLASEVTALLNSSQPTLFASIGCHAGLNVADADRRNVDFAQSILGSGGSFIGSTAYTYGGKRTSLTGEPLSLYSEELGIFLVEQMLSENTQTLGNAMRAAKVRYYRESSLTMSHTDEKVLSPMVLYGFPTTRITVPTARNIRASLSLSNVSSTSTLDGTTYVIDNLQYDERTHIHGRFFEYQGESYAKHGLPIQPSLALDVPSIQEGGMLRGAIIHNVTFSYIQPFDPVVAEAWVFDAPIEEALDELPITHEGYEFARPYFLSRLPNKSSERSATLNLILGSFDADNGRERLVESIEVELLYSDNPDKEPPLIESVQVNGTSVSAVVSDNGSVSSVVVVYENNGNWFTKPFGSQNGNEWQVTVPSTSERILVQAIDGGNNPIHGDWIEVGNSGIPTNVEHTIMNTLGGGIGTLIFLLMISLLSVTIVVYQKQQV